MQLCFKGLVCNEIGVGQQQRLEPEVPSKVGQRLRDAEVPSLNAPVGFADEEEADEADGKSCAPHWGTADGEDAAGFDVA